MQKVNHLRKVCQIALRGKGKEDFAEMIFLSGGENLTKNLTIRTLFGAKNSML